MGVALFASIFVIAAGIAGRFLKPTEEQLRPLVPEPHAGGDAHDDHGHGGHGHH